MECRTLKIWNKTKIHKHKLVVNMRGGEKKNKQKKTHSRWWKLPCSWMRISHSKTKNYGFTSPYWIKWKVLVRESKMNKLQRHTHFHSHNIENGLNIASVLKHVHGHYHITKPNLTYEPSIDQMVQCRKFTSFSFFESCQDWPESFWENTSAYQINSKTEEGMGNWWVNGEIYGLTSYKKGWKHNHPLFLQAIAVVR